MIMIAAIILSSLIGGRRSLLKEQKAVEDFFYNGPDGDGYSIQSDLEYIGATANNLKTIALRNDVSESLISSLTEARQTLSAAKSISEKYVAASLLFDAVTAIYNGFDLGHMNSTDLGFRSSLYDDISSAMQRISHNGYNDAAREFNALRNEFPAKLIAGFFGIAPAQIYG